ncbi:hypothetical protein GCM10010277_85050 [Streptomyces longisporoflavus]|nr:hypothetical protein GCM10010277_85050 [Streptomyces longisporoflavus]
MLDAGADLVVGLAVCLLPGGQFFAFAVAVGHHELRARIVGVCDGPGRADGGLRAELLLCRAAGAVVWQGPANHHDEPGIGVDDDLVVRGVSAVLGRLDDRAVAHGNQSACRPR